jgi:23S rRNA pseudouridine2605 synthase
MDASKSYSFSPSGAKQAGYYTGFRLTRLMRSYAGVARTAGGGSDRRANPHALARWLSKYGLASRSEARAMVKAGRVSVEDRVVRDPEFPCHPARQRILLDGTPLREPRGIYLLLHKPAGYVTTARDPEGRPTAYDLLPAGTARVQAAGRLDADSSGLLIFTNDTEFASRITEAGGGIEKEYFVTVQGHVRPGDASRFERGILLDGRKTRKARCEILGRKGATTRLRIVLREGRNRQIRRMFDFLGYPVVSLHRERVGAIRLGDLPPGRTRSLTRAERERTLSEGKVRRRL